MEDLFSFVRNVHADLCSGWTSLYSHYQCIREPNLSTPPCPAFVAVLVFFTTTILAGVRQISICVSLVTSDAEYFFMFIGHLYFIIDNYLLISLICVLTRLFSFWMFDFLSRLYVLVFSI